MDLRLVGLVLARPSSAKWASLSDAIALQEAVPEPRATQETSGPIGQFSSVTLLAPSTVTSRVETPFEPPDPERLNWKQPPGVATC